MLYTIENKQIKVVISDLGATITKFIEKQSNKDIVLGFDSDEDYIKYAGLGCGAIVGRNCNRIANACFELNGKEYQLRKNDGNNNLHGGGKDGFITKRYELVDKKDDEVTLTYLSKDGEEGFPGNLKVTINYKVVDNSLVLSFNGLSDADTIMNLTNHAYFNLGDKNILDHYLHIYSDTYAPTDEFALTLDTPANVKDTPFDFTSFTKVNDNIKELKTGIDNNYVFENLDDKLMAELRYNNLQLNIYSDLPDMHVYTAYYLNGEKGKDNRTYQSYEGIALECQYYPNAINYEKFIKPIVKKGEEMKHQIRFEIKNI